MNVEFELNSFLVSVSSVGDISVFTNNTLEQKDSKAIKKYLEGESGNNISLLLEEEIVAKELLKVLKEIRRGRIRRVYDFPYTLERGVVDSIRENGCATLFTTNENLQYDGGGRGFADKNNFKIVKIKKVKLLH